MDEKTKIMRDMDKIIDEQCLDLFELNDVDEIILTKDKFLANLKLVKIIVMTNVVLNANKIKK